MELQPQAVVQQAYAHQRLVIAQAEALLERG
jgi:hypothetical protein